MNFKQVFPPASVFHMNVVYDLSENENKDQTLQLDSILEENITLI